MFNGIRLVSTGTLGMLFTAATMWLQYFALWRESNSTPSSGTRRRSSILSKYR